MAIGYFSKAAGAAESFEGTRAASAVGTRVQPSLSIVDDDAAVAGALESVLASAGMAARIHRSGRAFLRDATLDEPGCVLLDERLPDMSGLDVLTELRARRSILAVVMISGYADTRMVKRAMWSGALDFLDKPVPSDELFKTVRASWSRSQELARARLSQDRFDARLATLTPREREVLDHLLQVKSSRVIAADLGRSMKTIEVHRGRLMKKMRVQSTVELVQLCARYLADC